MPHCSATYTAGFISSFTGDLICINVYAIGEVILFHGYYCNAFWNVFWWSPLGGISHVHCLFVTFNDDVYNLLYLVLSALLLFYVNIFILSWLLFRLIPQYISIGHKPRLVVSGGRRHKIHVVTLANLFWLYGVVSPNKVHYGIGLWISLHK